jgi:hypothetical protein
VGFSIERLGSGEFEQIGPPDPCEQFDASKMVPAVSELANHG